MLVLLIDGPNEGCMHIDPSVEYVLKTIDPKTNRIHEYRRELSEIEDFTQGFNRRYRWIPSEGKPMFTDDYV